MKSTNTNDDVLKMSNHDSLTLLKHEKLSAYPANNFILKNGIDSATQINSILIAALLAIEY